MSNIERNYGIVRDFLIENKVGFRENYVDRKNGVTIDLWIPKYRIAVRKAVGDDSDQEFYKAICKCYKPVFVREGETAEFTSEKIGNVMVERVQWLQKQYDKQQRKKALKEEEKKKNTPRCTSGIGISLDEPERKPFRKFGGGNNRNYQKRPYHSGSTANYERQPYVKSDERRQDTGSTGPQKKKRRRIVRTEQVVVGPRTRNFISSPDTSNPKKNN